jgi:hypothetical protein
MQAAAIIKMTWTLSFFCVLNVVLTSTTVHGDITVSCTAGDATVGQSSSLTCFFPLKVQEVKQDFTVYKYRLKETNFRSQNGKFTYKFDFANIPFKF